MEDLPEAVRKLEFLRDSRYSIGYRAWQRSWADLNGILRILKDEL